METVTVSDVVKKDTGWYDVTLEDGRVVSTKDSGIAQTAQQSVGTPIEAEINEQKNGKYTNIYLNKIGDVVDTPAASNGSSRKQGMGQRPETAAAAPIREDNRDERIARQWAFGRATELFVAGIIQPLSAEELDAIAANAEGLLARTRP